jgi:hypothetical protein
MKTPFAKTVVHYNRSEPFRSLTANPQEEWFTIVKGLNTDSSWGLDRFKDAEYLLRRCRVEQSLREEFVRAGGKPILKNPFYCFFGRNLNFEAADQRNKGYVIELEKLSPHLVTFTYGDSLLGRDGDYRKLAGSSYVNSLCGKIFLIEDLDLLLNQVPERDSLHIEVQLWFAPTNDLFYVL